MLNWSPTFANVGLPLPTVRAVMLRLSQPLRRELVSATTATGFGM